MLVLVWLECGYSWKGQHVLIVHTPVIFIDIPIVPRDLPYSRCLHVILIIVVVIGILPVVLYMVHVGHGGILHRH